MTIYVLIAQIFSVISWFLLLYSYYKDDIKQLIRIHILVAIMDILCYVFLGAITGLLVSIFELIQGIAYYKTDKAKNIFILTIPFYIIYSIYTFNNPIGLLPILATFIDNMSLTRGKKFATIGGSIAQIFWLIYDISVMSYVGALTDFIIVISNLSILILGYSYLKRIGKLSISRCTYLSNHLNTTLHNLDQSNYTDEFITEKSHKKNIFKKNKDCLFLINYKNQVIGYINYLLITKEEAIKLVNKRKFDNNYNIENITTFKKDTKNYLLINKISLDKKYQNTDSIFLINDNFKRYLKRKYYQGYKIELIIAPARNTFEQQFLEFSSFNKNKTYENNVVLYKMDSSDIENIYLDVGKYKILDNNEITDSIFDEIYKLDKKNLKEKDLWDKSLQEEIFNKNKDSFVIITRNDKVIGYLNYLCISKNTYNNINSNKKETLKSKEVKQYSRYDYNYINIESIVITKKYQNKEVFNLMINSFINKVRILENEDYFIKGINATPNNKIFKKIIRSIGLKKKKKFKDNTLLYLYDEEELIKLLK